jgi:ribosome-binding factor A
VPNRSPRRYPRTLRVNEVVRQVIADDLEQLSDPRLEMVTVTGVEVSADLRHATVFYAKLGKEEAETGDALARAAPRLRATLGREVRLKYLPELHFREDPAIQAGARIEAILRGLHPVAEDVDGERRSDRDGGSQAEGTTR